MMAYIIMGFNQIRSGQIAKGLMYLAMEIIFIIFMVMKGIEALYGLITLGVNEQGMVFNEESGIFERIEGDNSMLMLLGGVVVVILIVLFVVMYVVSIRDGKRVLAMKKAGHTLPGFMTEIRALTNENIHKLLLFIPLLGLLIFTIMPLAYMILMAFTNYDVNHQPPGHLFGWVGLENFKLLLGSTNNLAQTFWPVLGWTLVWAFFATFSNYILGTLLAILVNRKGINYKKMWRTIFIMSIAIPSFVGLLILRTMFNKMGVVNTMLINMGFINSPLPFLTSVTWARVTVIIANLWIGVPVTMLIATGILTNIPSDLYESARMDGASKTVIFFKITMPYMLFVTTPYLITNFIANVNNFNPIYFMTEGGPATLEYFKGAGKTDLLVTWLYKMTTDSFDYCYAAAIGIIIFVISATVSIIWYSKSNAFKSEEGFQI